jgi:hypothetical protein
VPSYFEQLYHFEDHDEKTRDGCIRIAGFVELRIMNLPETVAYRAAAARGDVLPVCIRLTTARAGADWQLRSELVHEVGPACAQASLDRACDFMPDAPEPRLLRAARSIAVAEHAHCGSQRNAWLAFAHDDLSRALRLDPMDPTARAMLAELVGTSAWGMLATCAA